MKFRDKMIIFTAIISILPIVIIGYISYSLGIGVAVKSEKNATQGIISRMKDDLTFTISEMYGNLDVISDELTKSSDYSNFLEKIKIIGATNSQYDEVYFGERTGKYYSDTAKKISEVKQEAWYKIAKKEGISVLEPSLRDKTLSISKAVYRGKEFLGVVGIKLSVEKVYAKIDGIGVGETGYIYIMNGEGIPILYPSDKQISLSMATKYKILESGSGSLDYKWDKKDSFVIYEKIESLNWIILGGTYLDEIKIAFKNIRRINFLIIMITIIVSSILIIAFLGMFTRRLDNITELASKVSQGDYSNIVENYKKDEFGMIVKEFNSLSRNQSMVLYDVKKELKDLYSISKKSKLMSEESKGSIDFISNSVEELQRGIENNAAAVEEASATIDSLVKESEEVRNLGSDILAEVEGTSKKAEEGKHHIEKIFGIMEELKDKGDETSFAVRDLTEESKNINKFLILIKNISEQTNLLAFNASVEAARAGESGQGFAVIAQEVGKLASRTKEITVDIEGIVGKFADKNTELIKKMDEQNEKILIGNKVGKDVSKELMEIISSVSEIEKGIKDISDATEKQAQDTKEISGVMNNIGITLQESEIETEVIVKESVKESKKAEKLLQMSRILEKISKNLGKRINQFKILEKDERVSLHEIEGVFREKKDA